MTLLDSTPHSVRKGRSRCSRVGVPRTRVTFTIFSECHSRNSMSRKMFALSGELAFSSLWSLTAFEAEKLQLITQSKQRLCRHAFGTFNDRPGLSTNRYCGVSAGLIPFTMVCALYLVGPSTLLLAQGLQHSCHQATKYLRRRLHGPPHHFRVALHSADFLTSGGLGDCLHGSPIKRDGMH